MDTIKEVAEFMKQHELLLVTAESCTAGLIAARLAEIPGAGALLDCAFVVYSPQAKQYCLDVSPDTMERFNLTSEEIAREMALGAIARSRANMAIANTGVADATDDEIPPGTQCFAWAFQRPQAEGETATPIVFTETRKFSGNRNEVREASAEYALQRIPFHFGRIDQS